MRVLIRGVLALLLMGLLATPAQAHYGATVRTAKIRIVQLLKEEFPYGVEPGGLYYCGRHGRHRTTCDILFTDYDGDSWCGSGYHYPTSRGGFRYRVGYRVSMRNCEYF